MMCELAARRNKSWRCAAMPRRVTAPSPGTVSDAWPRASRRRPRASISASSSPTSPVATPNGCMTLCIVPAAAENLIRLADLLAHGLVRASFVPNAATQEQRGLLRTRKQLVRERANHVQRLQLTLEDANIKLEFAVSDITGVSGRAMIQATTTSMTLNVAKVQPPVEAGVTLPPPTTSISTKQ